MKMMSTPLLPERAPSGEYPCTSPDAGTVMAGVTKKVRAGKSHQSAFLNQRMTPWNGALYTRAYLLKQLQQARWSERAIDFWVFRPQALSTQDITRMYACGHLINAIPNVFPGWYREE